VVQQLQQLLLRQPESTETAAALGLSLDGYYQMLRDSQVGTQVINFSYPDQEQNTFYDNLLETTADPETSAETQLATADRNQALQRTVAEVPNAEIRTVLTLHYFEEQSLKEIAASLKKSESRISQLHQDGLTTLRNLMKARGLTAEDLTISPEIPRQYVTHRL
jgi:RNA polymerase sigma factor for flagellar operon FliA